MSKGRPVLKLERCAKRGVPVEMPLLNPTKAKNKGYLEVKAYVTEIKKDEIDLTM